MSNERLDVFVDTVGPSDADVSLVFMHGGMGLDHTYFRPHVEDLAINRRLIFYDQRLNGRSPRSGAADVDLDRMARDTLDVARHYGRGTIVLVAHSLAAVVALRAAALPGGRVDALVLVSPVVSPSIGEGLMQHVMTRGSRAQQAALAAAFSGQLTTDEQFADAWLALLPLYFSRFDERVGADLTARIVFSIEAFQHFIRQGFSGFEGSAALAALRLPSLVISGADDWLEASPSLSGRTIAAAAPEASFVGIEHAGHYPFIEQPVRFCQIVQKWIQAIAPQLDP